MGEEKLETIKKQKREGSVNEEKEKCRSFFAFKTSTSSFFNAWLVGWFVISEGQFHPFIKKWVKNIYFYKGGYKSEKLHNSG